MSALAAASSPSARPALRRTEHRRPTSVFAGTVTCYLARVLPVLRAELTHWGARARAIPDAELRQTAADALAKRGNIEGAALFATLAPETHRAATTRALVAFQAAYNYLDALSEQPAPRPEQNARRLHEALLAALGADLGDTRYYSEHLGGDDDGGFLTDAIARCRSCCLQLPSFAIVAPRALQAAGRIVDFQALNMPQAAGGHTRLQRWAAQRVPPGSGLSWWELAGASGSSLAVHALLAAAGDPALTRDDAVQIEAVYFPWAGALHTMLDSLVDRGEDGQRDQPSLLDNCPDGELPGRLGVLASRARAACAGVPRTTHHAVIVTAMCSYYLSAPTARTAEAFAVRDALVEVLGGPLRLALGMFAGKRLLHGPGPGAYS